MNKEDIKVGQLFAYYEKSQLGCFDKDNKGVYVITRIFSHSKTGKLQTYICCLFPDGETQHTTIDEQLSLVNGNGFYFNGVTPHVAIDCLIKEFSTWAEAVNSIEFQYCYENLDKTFKKLSSITNKVVIPERMKLLSKKELSL